MQEADPIESALGRGEDWIKQLRALVLGTVMALAHTRNVTAWEKRFKEAIMIARSQRTSYEAVKPRVTIGVEVPTLESLLSSQGVPAPPDVAAVFAHESGDPRPQGSQSGGR